MSSSYNSLSTLRPSSGYGVPNAPPISSGYGVPKAPPITSGYGVPKAPALSSGYRGPAPASSFSTPQDSLNSFTSPDSYQAQNRPGRESVQVRSSLSLSPEAPVTDP